MSQFKVTFNTEDGLINYESPIVSGKLNAVIIDSMDKVAITISSSLGYPILHLSEHVGIKYYAPRIVLRGPELHGIVRDTFDKFALEEPLDIRISGPKNSEVSIIFRVD